jgi:hypothetical protein
MRRLLGVLAVLGIVTAAAMVAPSEAEARTRTFISVGAVFAPAPYYYDYGPRYYRPYRHYYPAPVYYVPPPPVYYAPAPVYVAPAPVYAPPPAPRAPYCRDYRGDAIIDGMNQPFYGTACLEADGRWHIRQ